MYSNAKTCMNILFVSKIVALISSVLLFLPIIRHVAKLAIIVCALLSAIALFAGSKDDEGYSAALIATIVKFVASIFDGKLGLIGNLMSTIDTVCDLIIVYFVCTTTAKLLRNVGCASTASLGMTVWNINLGCMIVSLVIKIIKFIPIINILGALAAVIVTIVSLVSGIMYLLFIGKAANDL